MQKSVNISDLKPVEDSEDSYSGYSREKLNNDRRFTGDVDYANLICFDCKKNKAELIRGTNEYLCVSCFKKWIETRKIQQENFNKFIRKKK